MADVDYYLKIDGIPGESLDKSHKNEIELESWSWGETNSGSFGSGTTGGGAGKVSMQDFHFTMKANKASPNLMLACANGKHIGEATLSCRKFGETAEDYLKIKFTDLLISSYQTGGSGGSNVVPSEQISFNFAKIEYTYQQQDKNGSVGKPVVVTWSLETNTK